MLSTYAIQKLFRGTTNDNNTCRTGDRYVYGTLDTSTAVI